MERHYTARGELFQYSYGVQELFKHEVKVPTKLVQDFVSKIWYLYSEYKGENGLKQHIITDADSIEDVGFMLGYIYTKDQLEKFFSIKGEKKQWKKLVYKKQKELLKK